MWPLGPPKMPLCPEVPSSGRTAPRRFGLQRRWRTIRNSSPFKGTVGRQAQGQMQRWWRRSRSSSRASLIRNSSPFKGTVGRQAQGQMQRWWRRSRSSSRASLISCKESTQRCWPRSRTSWKPWPRSLRLCNKCPPWKLTCGSSRRSPMNAVSSMTTMGP